LLAECIRLVQARQGKTLSAEIFLADKVMVIRSAMTNAAANQLGHQATSKNSATSYANAASAPLHERIFAQRRRLTEAVKTPRVIFSSRQFIVPRFAAIH
jgi:hypothetical protein